VLECEGKFVEGDVMFVLGEVFGEGAEMRVVFYEWAPGVR
jgi:hypothetical protein